MKSLSNIHALLQAKIRTKLLLSYLALGVGILSLSLSAMYVRWAQAPGTVTGFYRLLLSTIIILPFFIRRNFSKHHLTWSRIIPPLLGGICMAGTFSLWNTSLFYTNVASAAMIGNISPLWVSLAAWWLFRERLEPQFWLGLIVLFLGIALIMGGNFFWQPRLGLGDLMAAGSSFFYAAYILATQWGRRCLDSLSLVWINGASACIGMLFVIILFKQPLVGFPGQTWVVFLCAAILTQTIGYIAISYSLGNLPASVVSPSLNLQPVVTIVLAIPLLREVPSALQVMGSLLTLGGIYMINYVHQQKSRSAINGGV
jgi:drug/metabolite transporter (DMT)-like permease